MSAAYLLANLQAKQIVASLKSGAPLKGTVRSVDGAEGAALVAVEFPEVGERQVPVLALHLQPGDTVVIQCVPNPSQPGHYRFRIVSGESEPAARHRWTLWRGNTRRARC